jgi:hypothetical protein
LRAGVLRPFGFSCELLFTFDSRRIVVPGTVRAPCVAHAMLDTVPCHQGGDGTSAGAATQSDDSHLFEYVAPDLDKSVGWLEPNVGVGPPECYRLELNRMAP